MTIFNSKLLNYQKVYSIKWIIIPLNPLDPIKSQLKPPTSCVNCMAAGRTPEGPS